MLLVLIGLFGYVVIGVFVKGVVVGEGLSKFILFKGLLVDVFVYI